MIGSSGACLEYFPIQAPYLRKKYIMKKEKGMMKSESFDH